MTIALSAATIIHERRIRLVFSQPVASGAFGTPGPSFYTVTSVDSLSVSPTVLAAMLIPSNPNCVELALSDPLAKGGLYTIAAVGVPALDASVTPAGTMEQVRFGLTLQKENVEPIKADRERLLYGVDLLWNGLDYQEDVTGDLAIVSGTANVTKALYRVVEANGLPWDPTFGVGAREFVDSPSLASGTLRGKMSSSMLRDPRVKDVKIVVEFSGEDTFLHATPTLISGEPTKRVSLVVPS